MLFRSSGFYLDVSASALPVLGRCPLINGGDDKISGCISKRLLSQSRRGELPTKITLLGQKEFSIILREGKKRQIRRMLEAVGNKVVKLKRVRIKNIKLGDLPIGKYAYLSPEEIRDLF